MVKDAALSNQVSVPHGKSGPDCYANNTASYVCLKLMKFFKFLHAVYQSLYAFFRHRIVARCTETAY